MSSLELICVLPEYPSLALRRLKGLLSCLFAAHPSFRNREEIVFFFFCHRAALIQVAGVSHQPFAKLCFLSHGGRFLVLFERISPPRSKCERDACVPSRRPIQFETLSALPAACCNYQKKWRPQEGSVITSIPHVPLARLWR